MSKSNCSEKYIIQGCVSGDRSRERQRRRWREFISDWTGLDWSTSQHGSQRHGGLAQMDSWYDHRQRSWLDGTRRRRRYIGGEWPDEFLDSVIIPIEKKQRGAQDCVDFRTISLVSHASKSVEDFNPQARIYCRVKPWEGSVWIYERSGTKRCNCSAACIV